MHQLNSSEILTTASAEKDKSNVGWFTADNQKNLPPSEFNTAVNYSNDDGNF